MLPSLARAAAGGVGQLEVGGGEQRRVLVVIAGRRLAAAARLLVSRRRSPTYSALHRRRLRRFARLQLTTRLPRPPLAVLRCNHQALTCMQCSMYACCAAFAGYTTAYELLSDKVHVVFWHDMRSTNQYIDALMQSNNHNNANI